MKRRVTVEIDMRALARNYEKIAKRVSPLGVLCVLKANAYGLGVGHYAKALMRAGCRHFGDLEVLAEAGKRLAVLLFGQT